MMTLFLEHLAHFWQGVGSKTMHDPSMLDNMNLKASSAENPLCCHPAMLTACNTCQKQAGASTMTLGRAHASDEQRMFGVEIDLQRMLLLCRLKIPCLLLQLTDICTNHTVCSRWIQLRARGCMPAPMSQVILKAGYCSGAPEHGRQS